MKKLLVYIKDFRLECVLAPLFKLLEASFELIVPLIMAAIIDKGIPTGNTGFIVRMCLWLVALGGVGLLSSVTAQYFSAKAAIGFSARLRHVLMQHIQTLSYTELDTVGTSTLITRMNSDINQVQTGVNMCLRLLLRSPFVVFGAMIMAFTIDTRCAMIFAGVIVALCIIVFSIMLITIPMFLPVIQQLGISSLQFGIVMCTAVCIGFVTPPFGTCLFTGMSVSGVSMQKLVKAIFPFIISMIAVLLLITFIPQLTLWITG